MKPCPWLLNSQANISINAPEGCRHGTHYLISPRGEVGRYSRGNANSALSVCRRLSPASEALLRLGGSLVCRALW
jgi:hypothetical protein